MIIVNGFQQPLTIITKHSILDVAAALDPPLGLETNAGLPQTSKMDHFTALANVLQLLIFVRNHPILDICGNTEFACVNIGTIKN